MLKTSKKSLRPPREIRKRDGRIVSFDLSRITSAIFKAFEASGNPNHKIANELADIVLQKLLKKHKSSTKFTPTIEEIQDIVEETLIEKGHARIAKAYILYREKRAEIRTEKQQILDKEEIDEIDKKFDSNSLRVLKSRYLRKDESGKAIESPKELFTRVAIHASLPDIIYDKRVSTKKSSDKKFSGGEDLWSDKKLFELEGKLRIGKFTLNRFHIKGLHKMFLRLEKEGRAKINLEKLIQMLKKNQFKEIENRIEEFFNIMVERRFMPNTPAVANFGNYLGMGSACFALDIEDSIDSIMDTLKNAAVIFKSGGGLGYNFSKLRPEGDYIKTTGGTSSGPLIFMRLFDTMTEVIKQGGIRRGANMGIMNSNHPDIEKFVVAKTGNKALRNFNISVMLMPDFWEYYKKDKPYPLVNPRTGKVEKFISSRILLDRIAYQAWESGEPGVIFHDRINETNPFFKSLGPIMTTNPCGEVLLYPNESCNLGSINVWSFVKKDKHDRKTIEWDRLEKVIRTAVRFLDNVIDVNSFPLQQIEEMSLNTRKIGLGIMGVGNLMYEMEIPFNSQQGRNLMEKIMEFINYHSKLESVEMAKERGPFPYYKKSFYPEGKFPFKGFYDKKSWNFDWSNVAKAVKKYGIRNSYTTVIAPTGSISMITGCSSGIEPVFSLAFEKSVTVGSFYYIDPVFEKVMLREGLFDEMLIRDVITHNGSVANVSYIPPKFKKIFVSAHDITPEDHVKTLATFQKWVDSSISKTNNFPHDATVDDVKKSYLLAYEIGCKAVTVFRDRSIKDQVLVTRDKKKEKKEELIRITDVKAEGMAVYKDASVTAGVFNGGNYINGENGGGKPTHCPNCKIPLTHKEGCISCSVCGWGLCA
ncbi:adenosylcobalamin-dependent ribonucleoside-diphosphate reductase [Patescibacteria group bacterium]|nr:adenosylcobalamin-dependent ribonucleoside-diphosphate reductase [Patescibacteria group bacterium]